MDPEHFFLNFEDFLRTFEFDAHPVFLLSGLWSFLDILWCKCVGSRVQAACAVLQSLFLVKAGVIGKRDIHEKIWMLIGEIHEGQVASKICSPSLRKRPSNAICSGCSDFETWFNILESPSRMFYLFLWQFNQFCSCLNDDINLRDRALESEINNAIYTTVALFVITLSFGIQRFRIIVGVAPS